MWGAEATAFVPLATTSRCRRSSAWWRVARSSLPRWASSTVACPSRRRSPGWLALRWSRGAGTPSHEVVAAAEQTRVDSDPVGSATPAWAIGNRAGVEPPVLVDRAESRTCSTGPIASTSPTSVIRPRRRAVPEPGRRSPSPCATASRPDRSARSTSHPGSGRKCASTWLPREPSCCALNPFESCPSWCSTPRFRQALPAALEERPTAASRAGSAVTGRRCRRWSAGARHFMTGDRVIFGAVVGHPCSPWSTASLGLRDRDLSAAPHAVAGTGNEATARPFGAPCARTRSASWPNRAGPGSLSSGRPPGVRGRDAQAPLAAWLTGLGLVARRRAASPSWSPRSRAPSIVLGELASESLALRSSDA